MTSERLANRWGIAVAAVCMQICLGAVYGWSVFKKPLMGTEHWAETAVQLNFTLAIFFSVWGQSLAAFGRIKRDRAKWRPWPGSSTASAIWFPRWLQRIIR